MSGQYCFIIPNYNHAQVIQQTVASLQQYALPIYLIDDGSDQQTQAVLQQVAAQFPLVKLHRRAENGGKGAAVQTGLHLARQDGLTHALQIDADGQHDMQDIPALLQASRQRPQALISGQPVYDNSISKGRYYGRYLTHFWVYVETLSLSVKDSMCGFRVYPLAAYGQLIQKTSLGFRMDFDIEVMVRLYWQGTPVHFVPTKVHYPEGGVSHFNLWHDNWLITRMHTKLVFGMLWRLPWLVSRKFRAVS